MDFEYKFHINSTIKKADVWIVFEDLKEEIEYCEVPKENVIYLNNETSFKKNHFFEDHMVEFLNQFNYTYGCYPNLKSNHINTYPFLPWMIHANHGDSIFNKTSLNYIRKKIKLFNLSSRINLIKGNFKHTFKKNQNLPKKISAGIIDCDLYEGYKITLQIFWISRNIFCKLHWTSFQLRNNYSRVNYFILINLWD